MRPLDTVESRLKLSIPFRYLHGTQGKTEFQRKLLKETDRQLMLHGHDYLQIESLIVCLESCPHGLIASILDGHHKARLVHKYGIQTLPAHILTIDEVANQINLSPETLAVQLEYGRSRALRDFSLLMDRKEKRYIPQVIPDIRLEHVISLIDGLFPLEQSQAILQLMSTIGISINEKTYDSV